MLAAVPRQVRRERKSTERYVQGRCPFHSNDKRRPGTEEDRAEPSKSVRCLKGKGQKRKTWGCSSEEGAPGRRDEGESCKGEGSPSVLFQPKHQVCTADFFQQAQCQGLQSFRESTEMF